MIGYHYTSYKNYKVISKVGLLPYLISKLELSWVLRELKIPILYGIWTFQKRQQKRKLLGSLLWQLGTKNEVDLVELKCKFNREDLLGYPRSVKITHNGDMWNFIYHVNEPARIVVKPIEPENIKLSRTFNLIQLIETTSTITGVVE
jgi:hypothetical protein